MIRSSLRRWTGDPSPRRVRDTIAILLLLAIGTAGLIFVFSIPDPFATLPPQVPLLGFDDLPGSDTGTGFGISSAWTWREKREFSINVEVNNGTFSAGVGQTATWYANPLEAVAYWTRLDRTSYQEEPFVTSGGGDGKPVSMLFCGNRGMSLPEGFRECWYLAYWKHWHIALNYRSQLGEDLHILETQKIAARMDQLLMSAPDEPCYGILCTGTRNDSRP